jgi:hypothetical protein
VCRRRRPIAVWGAGIALLLTVRWEAIPYGEAVKV